MSTSRRPASDYLDRVVGAASGLTGRVDNPMVTRGSLDKELRTARRVVSFGVCVLLLALIAAAFVIQRVQAAQENDLTGRFDTRQATSALSSGHTSRVSSTANASWPLEL